MKYRLVSAALIVAAVILFLSGISAAGTYVGSALIVAAVVCETQLGTQCRSPGIFVCGLNSIRATTTVPYDFAANGRCSSTNPRSYRAA
jgi:hypothetical protein